MSVAASPGASGWLAKSRAVVARRVREREFWNTQIAVILVTALHVVVEAGAFDQLGGHGGPSLHHVPVVLYLLPVAYASLVYGLEGAILTGAWAGALALVNVPLWHAEAFDWVFEVAFILVVMGVGAVTARPVELERAQRLRAERAARRLAILNELAGTELAAMEDPEPFFRALAARLTEELDLVHFELALRRPEDQDPVVEVAVSSPESEGPADAVPVTIAIDSASLSGEAVLVPRFRSRLSGDDREFAATAIRQMSTRADNAALANQERATMETYVRLVTSAQEAERKRISLDLHDGPAQDLALLVRELDGPASEASRRGLRKRASAILDDVRRMARRQRPSALDVLGLGAALESTLGDVVGDDMTVDVEATGWARRLPSEVEEALYRIAQEAVRNAARHSGGQAVAVRVEFGEEVVTLVIEDDGSGFDLPGGFGALVRSGRMGVMGMTERARVIEADFAVGPRPGGGTRIAVVWPGTGSGDHV